MLSQRLTSVFKVISIYDDASLEIDDRTMALYVQKRDYALIEKEVEKLTVKPTIFHCRPLTTEKEYLADSMTSEGSSAHWQIFRHHVSKAEHFNGEDGLPVIQPNSDMVLDSKVREKIPRDIVQEIAHVIISKANESTKPFLMPDTWLGTRVRSRALRVALAKNENAKKKDTE